MVINRLIVLLLLFLPTLLLGQSDSTKFTKGDWGVGFDFGPCTGIGSSYGEARKYISNDCHVNIGLIFIKKKIHYVARLEATTGKLLKSLEFDNKWKQHNGFQSTNLELALGYHLVDIKRLNIVPFISSGVKYFNTYNSKNDVSYSLNGMFNYGLSLAIDYKIHFPIRSKNEYPGSKFTQQYLYIRLLGGIYPNYYNKTLNLKGGMTFLNLTIGGNFIPRKNSNSKID